MHPRLANLDQRDDPGEHLLSNVSSKASGLLLQLLLQAVRELAIVQRAQGDLEARKWEAGQLNRMDVAQE